MTLEQIKAELIAEQDNCDTVDSWGLGKYVGIQLALNMLDQLEPKMHPYPTEKPKENTWVFVELRSGSFSADYFSCGKFQWWEDEGETIVAWAELPKPFKKED